MDDIIKRANAGLTKHEFHRIHHPDDPITVAIEPYAQIIREMGAMVEWKPIARAEKPKAGCIRAYSYAPTMNGTIQLNRLFSFDSTRGLRVCDYYIDLPLPPQPQETDNG